MRRRAKPEPPPPPATLARFSLSDWYRPDEDPPPRSGVPYETSDDRYVYHFVKAIRRFQAAREAAGLPRAVGC